MTDLDDGTALTRDVLTFWFGDGDDVRDVWFMSDPAFDAAIEERFAAASAAAVAGDLDAMADTPEGALALILLLDQMPRNLHRGDAASFAGDARALKVAAAAIDAGWDQGMSRVRRQFIYMPFQHSEDLTEQERSVALFAALDLHDGLEWAERHREVVARFGRFPHRNAALGRETTAEETAFLAEKPGGF